MSGINGTALAIRVGDMALLGVTFGVWLQFSIASSSLPKTLG
jgi:hypothetical protein